MPRTAGLTLTVEAGGGGDERSVSGNDEGTPSTGDSGPTETIHGFRTAGREGNIEFFGVEQHALKHVQLFMGGVHIDLVDDTMTARLPRRRARRAMWESMRRRTNQPTWQIFGNSTVHLPGKVDFSTDFNAGGNAHYNVTTGFDNNGDGTSTIVRSMRRRGRRGRLRLGLVC